MTPQIPGYLTVFEAAVEPLVAAVALGLIWIGAARMNAPARSRYTTAAALSVALIAWLAIARYLGAANAYLATPQTATPTLLIGLLVPLAAAGLMLWRSERVASLVAGIPLPWLVAAQTYRIAGVIFLALWLDGRLPWQFALPAGIGDVATGCLAVLVAVALARQAEGARRATYNWCIFGIADLLVAIAMGAATSPGPGQLLAHDAPNLLISAFPLVMVPTFAVPLALLLHGIVLWRLRRETTGAGGLAGKPSVA